MCYKFAAFYDKNKNKRKPERRTEYANADVIAQKSQFVVYATLT